MNRWSALKGPGVPSSRRRLHVGRCLQWEQVHPGVYREKHEPDYSDAPPPQRECETNREGEVGQVEGSLLFVECHISWNPIKATFRDGATTSLLVSTGSFDISEQDRPTVSFGSEVPYSAGPDKYVPSSVLGLGFPQDRSLFRKPLVDQLVNNTSGYIKSRSFSLYLESGPLSRGEVLLGGVDPDRFIGPLASTPVVGEGHWMLHLLAVNVGGASRRQAGLHAILDTGTNGIYMPAKAREDLITLIKAGVEKPIDIRLNGGVYEVDCVDRNYLPIIELSFEGVGRAASLKVPRENYVEEVESSSTCTLLFFEDSEAFWRIGQNVLLIHLS
ncbi:hypothetical protein FOZ62_003080 [Perkinsus olseni]|uniref:Peptidase A1 domain-containing protein n=1 Tax=Perkinsus olseni TaxID=32597 RepID=A0A7J6R7M6_PEROL|nr:hypothetical protein FOZ62_003080 [Perkinsus olseni]